MLQDKRQMDRYTLVGFVAMLIFGCGPFLYLNIFGRGIFMYLSVLFIAAAIVQSAFFNTGKLLVSFSTTDKIYLLVIIWQIVSCLWSPTRNMASVYAFLKVVIFYFLTVCTRYSKKDIKRIVSATILISVFSAIYLLTTDSVVSEIGVDGGRKTFDFFGVSQDPNYLCFIFIMPFAYCVATVLDAKKNLIVRLMAIGCIILVGYGVLLTGSRGGLLALGGTAFVYVLTYQKSSFKKIFVFGLLAVAFLVVFNNLEQFLPENLVERFSMDTILDTGGSKRTDIWQMYIEANSDFAGIMMGQGFGAGAYLIGSGAHNYWIETYFNYGLIGLILVLCFWGNVIIKNVKNKNWIVLSSTVGTLLLATTLSVGSILQFWLAVSIIGILINEEQLPENKVIPE